MTPKSKSKYNRYHKMNNPKPSTNEPVQVDPKSSVQFEISSGIRSKQTANPSVKINLDMAATSKNFISELKWITLVTGVIIILLMVSYFIFR
jgi:hypothetical protein